MKTDKSPFWTRARMALARGLMGKSAYGAAFRGARDLLAQHAAGRSVNDPYKESGPFKRGVDRIAGALSSVPFKIYRQTGSEEEVTTGVVYRTLRKPNDYTSRRQLFAATAIHLVNDGEALWGFDKVDTDGLPRELWVLNPDWLTAKKTPEGMLAAWEFRPPGSTRSTTYTVDESIFFRNYNPDDQIRGMPFVSGGLADLNHELWGKALLTSMLRDGTFLGNIFTPDKPLEPDVAERIAELIREQHGGPGQGFKNLFLEHGINVEKTGIPPAQMGFRDHLSFAREEIGGNLGVPPLFMQILEFANYANARVQERIFWTGTVIPLMHQIQDTLDSQFFARLAPELVGIFDTSDVAALKQDFREKIECGQILNQMGFTGNEINELLDLGFDDKPWRDEVFIPFTLIPASAMVGRSPDELMGGGASEERTVEIEQKQIAGAVGLDKPSVAGGPPGSAAPALALKPQPSPEVTFPHSLLRTESSRVAHWKAFDGRLVRLERQLIPKIRGYYAEQRREVLENIVQHGQRSLRVMGRKFQTEEIRKQTLEELIDFFMFDIDKALAKLRGIVKPYIVGATQAGGEQFLAGVEVDPFDLDDPAAIANVKNRTLKIKGIVEQDAKELRESLLTAMREGQTVQDLATTAKAIYEKRTTYEARRIARTEMAGAANGGAYAAAKMRGIDKHEWLSARDDAVRDTHAAEDGNVVAVGSPFPVTGLLHPLDPAGPPGEVIQCRCSTVPAMEDIGI